MNHADRSSDAKNSEDAFSVGKSKFGSGNTSQNYGQNREKVFRGKYHKCHEEGHFVRDCPKRNTCAREDPNNPTNKGTTSKGAASDAEDQSPDKCHNEALSVFTSNVVGKSDWIINSEGTQHMSFERDRLTEYVEFKQPCAVNLGDSRTILTTLHLTLMVKLNQYLYAKCCICQILRRICPRCVQRKN